MTTVLRDSLVWKLAGLLRQSGDVVLSGCSTLSLLTATLQQLNHVFELHLGPWSPGQTGFVALPSHPADSPVILQLQFLFDVLQKTLSLKLVHVPGPGPPGPIKIFPFKSLRQLELRGVPLHCLRGLRSIYSQLETLICSRSIQALEELLSACGGDLCSALPWLALLSANFSYNSLTALDSSLRLLSVVRFLNLSHNHVRDCEAFLMDLSELYHLDVSYNCLRLVPRMGPSGVALGTLILRGNELRSLLGVEQLRNLRHLDVAYNLLEGHGELSPLWLLAELRKLYLEGNPLWFHPAHRAATAQYLSPRARDAVPGFLLDGEVLSVTDFQVSWFVKQHRDLELMNSFRERFGCDWLQYRNHLETSENPHLATSKTSDLSSLPPDALGPEPLPPEEADSPEESAQEASEEIRVGPEPQEEEEMEEPEEEEGKEDQEEEEEQDEVEAELCRPMLVCPLQGPEGVRGRERFLRVTSAHLFEVELQAARILERLELQSLEAAEIEPVTQTQRELAPGDSDGLAVGRPGRDVVTSNSALSLAPASLVLCSCFSSVFSSPQVPLVLAGHRGEFLCLVVVSDRRLYVLRVTGEIRGPPAGWLQPTLAVPLQDLSGLELGLAGQSLRLEWAAGGSSCVLLPRDVKHCRAFLGELTDVLQSLPPTWRSCVRATEEVVTPQHRLWPLLDKDSSLEAPRFFYLRVFLVEGSSPCPVSLLLTLSTLYLLDEHPAGPQAEPPPPAASGKASEKTAPLGPGPSVGVREQQPLSSLSSVLLYRTAPRDFRLVFYDEVWRGLWETGAGLESGSRQAAEFPSLWALASEALND
ncbi:serine/threonine-protein kinase 11-interacting protein [Trichechus manatus latirostris]|uniref:Serine/threonine-protein kinase 11-interacting protein n=1 Tax=Trichechus manatus latirostris TaxID=127582 RepID=A0A2Y9QUB7_TRIMA|nr:serine/threonine-protein kinase 11-interacting protein [Trichechus manatus latirostris]